MLIIHDTTVLAHYILYLIQHNFTSHKTRFAYFKNMNDTFNLIVSKFCAIYPYKPSVERILLVHTFTNLEF